MKKNKIVLCLAGLLMALAPNLSIGADTYVGDTAIYGATSNTVQPNVLLVVDTSDSMLDAATLGDPFDPAETYPTTYTCGNGSQECVTNSVYKQSGVEKRWTRHGSLADYTTDVSCAPAFAALDSTATYQGALKTNGNCGGSSVSVVLGNYLNWLAASAGAQTKIDVAREVMTDLIYSTAGVKIGLMTYVAGGQDGGEILGWGASGSNYEALVKDMEDTFGANTCDDVTYPETAGTTNRAALICELEKQFTVATLQSTTQTPLAETMYEARQYYASGKRLKSNETYTTPIEYVCQKNYVVFMSDGMSKGDSNPTLKSFCNGGAFGSFGATGDGDCDGDSFEEALDPRKGYGGTGSTDYFDDVSMYINQVDLLADDVAKPYTIGDQVAEVFTISFGLSGDTGAQRLLEEGAANGSGDTDYLTASSPPDVTGTTDNYFEAGSTAELSEALRVIFATIAEENSSFVAPVLPVSPENRTYTGSRIFMGFFKPQQNQMWLGNLKKYILAEDDGSVQDKDGVLATNTDGSIKDTAISFWSAAADGSDVDAGGVGEILMNRDFASDPRKLYTFTGTSTDLTHSSNSFSDDNSAITEADLGAPDAATRTAIINYIHGYDAYDEDNDTETTDKREWIMADVLHSRPLVTHYTSFVYDDAGVNEANCSTNKSLIFVGSNGGMMHAFRDCNGEEAWAFVPQDLLPELSTLSNTTHNYFVDSSPAVYVHDVDNDGNIETSGPNPDKVILVFGERRGGNYYYVLDVSDPDGPVYMGRISSTEIAQGTTTTASTAYGELGESWSEPTIELVEVDVSGTTKVKVGVFFGAGYDNDIEDVTPHSGSANTKGRGFYLMELAELNSSGYPVFSSAMSKLWGYTYSDNSLVNQSVPSEMAAVDLDGNGFVDTLYVGDTGGNMWRVGMTNPVSATWTVNRIFSSGGDRKIFYKPSVVQEHGFNGVYFNTGDRAHPKVTTEVDRLYMLKDTGQTTASGINDTHMQDLTSIATAPDLASHQGWYIRLTSLGEKGLSAPAVISGVASYTTYEPPSVGADPCLVGDRGTARLYSVDYLDASAVVSLDQTNDEGGVTYERSTTVGSGIPSGMVTGIGKEGYFGLLGVGGGLPQPKVKESGGVLPTYWREIR